LSPCILLKVFASLAVLSPSVCSGPSLPWKLTRSPLLPSYDSPVLGRDDHCLPDRCHALLRTGHTQEVYRHRRGDHPQGQSQQQFPHVFILRPFSACPTFSYFLSLGLLLQLADSFSSFTLFLFLSLTFFHPHLLRPLPSTSLTLPLPLCLSLLFRSVSSVGQDPS
jgi:hypothetical protein